MGRWRWLNWALLAVAALYGAWFLLGRTEGSFAGSPPEAWTEAKAAEGPASGLRLLRDQDRRQLKLRLPPDGWRALRSACLATDAAACFTGGRNAFMLARAEPGPPDEIVAVRIRGWDFGERVAYFRFKSAERDAGGRAGS